MESDELFVPGEDYPLEEVGEVGCVVVPEDLMVDVLNRLNWAYECLEDDDDIPSYQWRQLEDCIRELESLLSD